MLLTKQKKGEHFSQELIHYKRWYLVLGKGWGQPLFDSKGNVKEYFALIEDISTKKQDEEGLKGCHL
jgi:hypothetical protein